ANSLKSANRLPEAETALGAALSVHRQLAEEFHTLPEYQNDLAGALVDLAQIRMQRNDLQYARQLLEEARPHHEAALKAQPRHPVYRQFYRNNLSILARVSADMGDYRAALAALRDSLSQSKLLAADFPDDPAHRRVIASTQSLMA